MSIKFFLNIAPMFETYLTVFQSKEPLIQCAFGEMKNLLVSLQRRFIKPINFEGKTAEELMKIDAADKENHLEMRNIDFGVNVKEQVS